jgi:hypothetical protein
LIAFDNRSKFTLAQVLITEALPPSYRPEKYQKGRFSVSLTFTASLRGNALQISGP